jgi:hypothetical protein
VGNLLFWFGIGAAQKAAVSKEVKSSRHSVIFCSRDPPYHDQAQKLFGLMELRAEPWLTLAR